MHVITLLLIEWEFISIINCTCHSVTYMRTRPLNKGTNRPITLCTVKLFIQLMYNKNDHLAKWSIFFGRRSNIALDLQFMQIFTNQKYS